MSLARGRASRGSIEGVGVGSNTCQEELSQERQVCTGNLKLDVLQDEMFESRQDGHEVPKRLIACLDRLPVADPGTVRSSIDPLS